MSELRMPEPLPEKFCLALPHRMEFVICKPDP